LATPATDVGPGAELELSSSEREVLAEEVGVFARTLKDPDTRERYAQLGAAVQQGTVPPHVVGLLETMLELVLQTQRVRRQHGPEAEQALLRLFHRTPRGAALEQAAREVNAALAALRGHVLESLTFSPTPRGHNLVIDTAHCSLTLAIDRAGVRVERLETGA
jgi:hypothetical protein